MVNLQTLLSGRCVGETWKCPCLTYSNGTTYSGWVLKKSETQLVKHGSGVSSSSRKVYEGLFKDDHRHGKGRLVFASGTKYQGEFQRGEFHGAGKMSYSNGSSFSGQWVKGKIKRGVLFSPELGGTYDGDFNSNGKPHGYGILTKQDGSYFRGIFREGKLNGRVEHLACHGTKTYQIYEDGRPCGPMIQTDAGNAPLRLLERVSAHCMHGREDGESHDEGGERIRFKLGRFKSTSRDQVQLVQGTYSTMSSQVSSQTFTSGPTVPQEQSACWHDVETGNLRFARVGPNGDIVGKSLFVFANQDMSARLEDFQPQGAMHRLLD